MADEKKEEGWGSFFKTMIIALLLALAIRSLAFEPFSIPSRSMEPTLLVGDYLFVSKYAYGYSRFSFPVFGLPIFQGRIFFTPPQRGDVMVFRNPQAPSIDFIKRLIGLPGDRIQFVRGVLYINDQAVSYRRLPPYFYEEGKLRGPVEHFSETLPEGKTYNIIHLNENRFPDNTSVYIVPEGYYFVAGDNRDNSEDSRFIQQLGFIPEDHLIGRAERVFFSLANAKFWQFWKWPSAIRTNRILMPIE